MRRTRLHYLLPIALVVGVAVTAAPPAMADPGAPTVAAATNVAEGANAVTLITGDRVTVSGGGQISVEPGAGRAGMQFITRIDHEHRIVIPVDAVSLLAAGRLDQRLFDVTGLVAAGYEGGRLPLLVAYPKKDGLRKAQTASTVAGARVVRDLSGVGLLAVDADGDARAALWTSLTKGAAAGSRALVAGVDKVWLDGVMTVSDDVSGPQIGVPAARQAGLDGTGVTVAVLDTGIDATHPDLAGKIVEQRNFTTDPNTDDTIGHGTHVASIIAGSGAASGGRYSGVAPGAKLLIGKVCVVTGCPESSILAGMQWAAQSNTPVVNLSLGAADTPGVSPLEQAVNDLTAQFGTLFVIAAGNDGAGAPVSAPATADAALAVGAVDSANQLAPFSSRGPRPGDEAIKPDVTAPGVGIVAARAAHATIGDPAPVAGYSTLSGTSMATPHVAAAAAVLTQEHPGWTPAQRKTALMASALPTAGLNAFAQGAGRIDLARAITATVATNQGSVSFGLQSYPHGDDTPVTKSVTYRNDGTEPVTLSLAVKADQALPAGAIAAAATAVTVPAGGAASTSLTVNTSLAGPDGFWTGALIATAPGGVRVTTPWAVDREVPMSTVTLSFPKPVPFHYVAFVNLATHEQIVKSGTEAVPVVRLPRGRYGIFTWINGPPTSMLVQPALTIDHDLTVVLDAAKAKPVSITVPRPDAVSSLGTITAQWDKAGGAGLIFGTATVQTGQIAAAEPAPEFTAQIATSFVKAGGDRNSPYVYELTWFDKGTFWDGLTRHYQDRDLATLQTTYARSAGASVTGVPGVSGRMPGVGSYVTAYHPVTLPFSRPVYVNTEDGLQWSGQFQQWAGKQLDVVDSAPVRYLPGHTYEQQWNRGVFGPAGVSVLQSGENFVVTAPMFGDGAGRPGSAVAVKPQLTIAKDGKRYQLTATATRGTPFELSTSVGASWNFAPSKVAVALPTIRFAPPLDEQNSAPAGVPYAIPVVVDRGRTDAVEVSYDDGKTWWPALMLGGVALVWHPWTPGYVSLRAHARDAAGNTVTETILRGYKTR